MHKSVCLKVSSIRTSFTLRYSMNPAIYVINSSNVNCILPATTSKIIKRSLSEEEPREDGLDQSGVTV